MNLLDLSNHQDRVLPRMLRQQAEQIPDSPFLLSDDQSLSFSDVERMSAAVATGLVSLGVTKADRVALLLSNRLETVVIALAVNRIGAVWVPICTDYKGEWLADAVKRSKPVLLFTEATYADRVSSSIDNASNLRVVMVGEKTIQVEQSISYETLLENEPHTTDLSQLDVSDPVSIVWTSGTTGKSKGVMLNHNNWIRPTVLGSSVFYESREGDVIFNVLPLYHAAAWNTAIFRALIEGIPVVVESGFSVTNFWDRIHKFSATQTFTLGAMHMFLWQAPETSKDADTSLRIMQAIPMPNAIKPGFEKRFGLTVVGGGLGQSECMLITTTAGCEGEIPPNSIGLPKDDTDIGLFDDNDQEVVRGEVGEIRIRPLVPNVVCNGYFDDPEATEAAWKDGWYCTGDLGRQDEQGFYFFADRKKDSIRFAGRNISTLEVEGVVRQHPDVADVAAYGIPAKELEGEDELKIDLVLKEGSTLGFEEMAQFINNNAPYYFVPRYMELVSSLPYTPTNKVQKFKLREQGLGVDVWDRSDSQYVVQR